MKRSVKIKNYLEYAGFRLVLFLLRIPPYRFMWHSLGLLGVFVGTVLKIRYQVVYTQMKQAFPDYTEQNLQKTIKETYRHLGYTMAEIYLSDFAALADSMTWEGREHIDNALAGGKGMILASGHFGNWEVGTKSLSYFRYGVSGVVKKQRNVLFDDYNNKTRCCYGLELIERKGALRPILKALRRNRIVGILIDQDARDNGILTDFLGREASTYKGAAKIAIMTKTPILSAYCIRGTKGELKIIVFPVHEISNYEDTDEGVYQLTMDLNHDLEGLIRQYPYLWFWLHKRWKGVARLKDKIDKGQVGAFDTF